MTEKVKRPTRVKVGYQWIKIKWLSEREWMSAGHAENDAGNSWWGVATINIRTEQSGIVLAESAMQETLLHEILHMCYEVSNLNKAPFPEERDEREEQIVGMMAVPLTQVLQDNKEVLAYISQ